MTLPEYLVRPRRLQKFKRRYGNSTMPRLPKVVAEIKVMMLVEKAVASILHSQSLLARNIELRAEH